jgi:flagellar M-ring protein FliF
VALTLKPGVLLGRAQVTGMQRLVAASVAGLDPSSVVINDQRGVTLSAVDTSQAGSAGSDARLTVQRDVENYLADKITRLLDRAYGAGQALVSVDVALNFDQVSTTVQSLVPLPGTGKEEGAVLRRQQVSTGGSGHDTPLATGPAGPSEARALGSTTDVEYEYGRRVEQIVSTPGSITRMSIGVIVPGSLTDGKRQRIVELVSTAAGASESRGDQIDIETLAALRGASAGTSVGTNGGTPAHEPRALDVPLRTSPPVARYSTALGLGAGACLVLGALLGVALGRGRARAKPLSPRERQRLLLEMERALTVETAPASRSGA